MTTIKLKNGSGAPLAGDLVVGEPALDLTNKRLYTEDSGGTVIEVGTNPSTINIDAGTIDGTVIGGTTPAAGSFTTFTSTGIDDNAASTAITIDSSQNVGIGTVPNSWGSTYEALSVGPWSTLGTFGNADGGFLVGNAYHDGTDWKYRNNGTAEQYKFLYGEHVWAYAASGTANNNITFNEAMRLDSSGNLLVGKTSAGGVATVGAELRGSAGYVISTASSDKSGWFGRNSTDGDIVGFYKDGTTVGSIGVTGGDLMIGQGAVGVRFLDATPSLYPTNITSGATADASIDIGTSAARFKDLYLSGGVIVNGSAAFPLSLTSSAGESIIALNNTSTNGRNYYIISGGSSGSFAGGMFGIYDADALSVRMAIDSSGNLLVGTASTSIDTSSNDSGFIYKPGNCLVVSTTLSGNSNVILNKSNSQAGTVVDIRYNGSIVGTISNTASSTAYNTTSDYRLKENVVPLTGATERVKQLNPSRFNFIADADTTVDGFLAHEVADVVPEAITGTKDGMRDEEYEVTPAVYEDVIIPAVLDEEGNEVEAERTEQQLVTEAVMGTRSVPDYQGIDQSKLVPLLVATIQELEARITALESN